MSQNYSLPTHIFLVFDKAPVVTWTSHTVTPNTFMLLLNNCWAYSLTSYFKKELNLHDIILVENSVVLNNSYYFNNFVISYSKVGLYLNYYLFYFYNLKIKVFLMLFNSNSLKFNSIDLLFPNAGWLERETAEMYGIFFSLKKDIRKLLLDYSRTEFPLLKDFSSEGYTDCFYSIFENDVVYINNDIVEL